MPKCKQNHEILQLILHLLGLIDSKATNTSFSEKSCVPAESPD